ncbi:MAG: NUDIX domain-containing protein [Rubritalea sp.]|jgi:putative (di)nucleoside polyphosphate hydrolase
MPKFRPNVAAIILNKKGEILVCERKNDRGAWQFPQGGVDGEESRLEALEREIMEEVGIPSEDYKTTEYRDGYFYFYPAHIRSNKKWDGQEQTYFLCRLKKKAKGPDLGKNNPEFRDFDWVMPEDFDAGWLPGFKLEVYREVMRDFFGLDL